MQKSKTAMTRSNFVAIKTTRIKIKQETRIRKPDAGTVMTLLGQNQPETHRPIGYNLTLGAGT